MHNAAIVKPEHAFGNTSFVHPPGFINTKPSILSAVEGRMTA
jgi:hypothetical protein